MPRSSKNLIFLRFVILTFSDYLVLINQIGSFEIYLIFIIIMIVLNNAIIPAIKLVCSSYFLRD